MLADHQSPNNRLRRICWNSVWSKDFVRPRRRERSREAVSVCAITVPEVTFIQKKKNSKYDKLTDCWMLFQDKGKAGRLGQLQLLGFHSNQSDTVHTLAHQCCVDIAIRQTDTRTHTKRWDSLKGLCRVHRACFHVLSSGKKPLSHSCTEMKEVNSEI